MPNSFAEVVVIAVGASHLPIYIDFSHLRVPGAAPDQSRSAGGVYTNRCVKQKMWGVGYLAPPSFIRSLRSVMNCGGHSWLLTLMVSIPIADTVNGELLEVYLRRQRIC